jgi:hypothetical protein
LNSKAYLVRKIDTRLVPKEFSPNVQKSLFEMENEPTGHGHKKCFKETSKFTSGKSGGGGWSRFNKDGFNGERQYPTTGPLTPISSN